MAVRSLRRRRAASLPSSLPPRAPPPASLRQAELKRRRVQFERDLLLLAQGDSSEWRSQVPAHNCSVFFPCGTTLFCNRFFWTLPLLKIDFKIVFFAVIR